MNFRCPTLNERCLGPKCGNWNDPDSKFGKPDLPRGCKGDNPTFAWARWYLKRFGDNSNASVSVVSTPTHTDEQK